MSKQLLHQLQINYFHLFLFSACAGPCVGFIITLFFPKTLEDQQRKKRTKEVVCRKGNNSSRSAEATSAPEVTTEMETAA